MVINKCRFNSLLIHCRTLLTHATTKLVLRTAINLSYKLIGEGTTEIEEPPIFLLHGLLASKKHWKGIGKTIRNMTRRSVIVVDLRNHGGSPHVSSNKYDEMAQDMVNLLNKLEIQKASLVGHSIGGRTAMCVSLLAPERVAGLVVVDISPVSTSKQLRDMARILNAMKAIDFKHRKKVPKARKEAKNLLRDVVADDFTLCDIISNINIKPDGKIGWTCNLDVLIKQFSQLTSFPKMEGKKYNGPCLFIGGQQSEYLPADDLTHIREIFPQAVITYIPKTGHHTHAEDPKTFLELTIAFLRTNH